MTQQEHIVQEQSALRLKPIVSYPREAKIGERYLFTIDVQLAEDSPWPYQEEEFEISFILETTPFFTHEPLGEHEPGIVLHRYGGTYGAAEYLLTASKKIVAPGKIKVTLLNGWGLPIAQVELECEVKKDAQAAEKRTTRKVKTGQELPFSNAPTQQSIEEERFNQSMEELFNQSIEEEQLHNREQQELIARQLSMVGWDVKDAETLLQGATIARIIVPLGNIALQGYPLAGNDYLLIINREIVGFVKVYIGEKQLPEKVASIALSDAITNAKKSNLKIYDFQTISGQRQSSIPFIYHTTGYETTFRNYLEPSIYSRNVYTFHQPSTFVTWLSEARRNPSYLLRARLLRMPPVQQMDLREHQLQAITNLERSLAENRPRTLIQMAVGSGKTATAINSIYRLLRFGGTPRILYLTDRSMLAHQVQQRLLHYIASDDGQRFTDLYNVQLLVNNKLDPGANVCIATIQRLYSILVSQPYIDDVASEASIIDQEDLSDHTPSKEVKYNLNLPIEFFDFVFIDECHRSIYQQWRPILEYLDAFLIGFTAVSSERAFTFFNRNLVMQYSSQQALEDGLIVDYEIYPVHIDQLEADILEFTTSNEAVNDRIDAVRDSMTINRIHAVLENYHNALFTKLFPGRSEVPKTLIFAQDDQHADRIVQILREVFAKDNNFVKKITYQAVGGSPEEFIYEFSDNYYPRIVVTVNMLLGFIIPPLEVLLFMRNVRSKELLEQMIGLGCTKISDERLRAVTPDAHTKTHFVVVDATDVTRRFPPLK